MGKDAVTHLADISPRIPTALFLIAHFNLFEKKHVVFGQI
jgi:hypothetical protein